MSIRVREAISVKWVSFLCVKGHLWHARKDGGSEWRNIRRRNL